MAKSIAIITARGGSKRIPRKNIKEFCGKPILAYSIDAALESGIFDEVMVSTDDEEIATIAREYGAQVPFLRSEKTSDDFATTKDVLFEVLERYEEQGQQFDYMCCIYPTAPFVTPRKLTDAMDLLIERKAELVMPVVQFSFPPQRCNIIDSEGFMQFKFPEYRTSRSQDLEKWYHDAGQFYAYDIQQYKANDGVCTKTVAIEMSELEVQDIDNEIDWKMAELKYKMMMS